MNVRIALLTLLPLCGVAARSPQSYRDGARLVSFTREAEHRQGLQHISLRSDDRSWSAWVGSDAVIRTRDRGDLEGLTLVRTLSSELGLHLVRGHAHEDGAALAARLSARGLNAVPDLYRERRRTSIDVPPNDPRYPGQWYFAQLGVEAAWHWTVGDPSIVVAVVDNGFDVAHPDLAGKFVGQRDLLDGDDDAQFVPNVEGNEHGTACAGIIAANTDNGLGIAGACPLCKLAGIRLISADKQLTPLSADLAAFEYAFEINAAVVSNSWGYTDPGPVEDVLARAVTRLTQQGYGGRGALVVFAAGNENRAVADDELLAFPGVLAVSALNRYDEAAPFVNHGNAIDLSASAGTVTTDISGADGASKTDYTDVFGGTSSACPVVAGIAALLRSAAPEARAEQVMDALLQTARRAPFATAAADQQDPIYGYGIMDPVAALRVLAPAREPKDAGFEAAVDASAVPIEIPGARPPMEDAGTAERRDSAGCELAERGAALHPLWLLALLTLLRRRTAEG